MKQKPMEITEQQQLFLAWTREHAALLHHVVNGFASGLDRDDLRQDVMLAIWKSIPEFRYQAKPPTYLYRVCHNAVLMWTRSEKNYRLRIEKYTADNDALSDTDFESTPKERVNQLYTAIHRLRPMDRSLILMLLDGLSYREMAEILGLTENNIGTKISRIKKLLSQMLKGNQHEPN